MSNGHQVLTWQLRSQTGSTAVMVLVTWGGFSKYLQIVWWLYSQTNYIDSLAKVGITCMWLQVLRMENHDLCDA